MPSHSLPLPLQMAARETGIGAVEQYMHAGKLLALDLLVQVLENPTHNWSTVRPEVCTRLQNPCTKIRCVVHMAWSTEFFLVVGISFQIVAAEWSTLRDGGHTAMSLAQPPFCSDVQAVSCATSLQSHVRGSSLSSVFRTLCNTLAVEPILVLSAQDHTCFALSFMLEQASRLPMIALQVESFFVCISPVL